jgi:large subunit ribosomal protein L3
MKFILGIKDSMTQVFDDNGVAHPATILRVEPSVITQVKTKESDGYDAVQVASIEQKEHRVGKATKGHFGKAYKHAKEFRPNVMRKESLEGMEKGASIKVSVFEPGDTIAVSAISKGKGFQGGVKRHGFKGGPASHGHKHNHRAPGSIGSTGPARVFKGVRMAGRMGADRVTVKNLKVLQVNEENNILLVGGAVPGRKGTLVEVRGI